VTVEALKLVHQPEQHTVKLIHLENTGGGVTLKLLRELERSLEFISLDTMVAGQRVVCDVVVSRVLQRITIARLSDMTVQHLFPSDQR